MLAGVSREGVREGRSAGDDAPTRSTSNARGIREPSNRRESWWTRRPTLGGDGVEILRVHALVDFPRACARAAFDSSLCFLSFTLRKFRSGAEKVGVAEVKSYFLLMAAGQPPTGGRAPGGSRRAALEDHVGLAEESFVARRHDHGTLASLSPAMGNQASSNTDPNIAAETSMFPRQGSDSPDGRVRHKPPVENVTLYVDTWFGFPGSLYGVTRTCSLACIVCVSGGVSGEGLTCDGAPLTAPRSGQA